MIRAIIAALALSACASASGQGTTADWGSNSWVNAADLGGGLWLITCTSAASACTERAARVCASGFDVEQVGSGAAPVAVANNYGAAMRTQTNYQMQVRCKP
jgi:hypothetical protein